MMQTKLLVIIVGLVELFAIKAWITCKSFSELVYFSSFDVKLKVEEQVHNDVGYGTAVVRFFHNKVFLGYTELFKKYLFFWDSNFHVLFFSLVGSCGILCGIWYLLTSKHKRLYKWTIFLILGVLPLIEVFSLPIPFIIRVVLLWGTYSLFSLYGIWHFLVNTGTKGKIIVTLLIGISLWYLWAFSGDIYTIFCYNK